MSGQDEDIRAIGHIHPDPLPAVTKSDSKETLPPEFTRGAAPGRVPQPWAHSSRHQPFLHCPVVTGKGGAPQKLLQDCTTGNNSWKQLLPGPGRGAFQAASTSLHGSRCLSGAAASPPRGAGTGCALSEGTVTAWPRFACVGNRVMPAGTAAGLAEIRYVNGVAGKGTQPLLTLLPLCACACVHGVVCVCT